MNQSEKQLEELFFKIKKMGWIKSKGNGYSGIGITFEKLIGKEIENFEIPDFEGIEIKTKRNYSTTNINLFNATPDGQYLFEIKRLRDKYGYPDKVDNKFFVLNNTITAIDKVIVNRNYKFMLKNSLDDKKIFLCVYTINNTFHEKSTYWSYEMLEEKANRKLKTLAYIKADTKIINGDEYFLYQTITFYKFKGFNTFLELLEKGKINITFKIGVFRNGKRYGEIHDHGTGFIINENDLQLLYNKL